MPKKRRGTKSKNTNDADKLFNFLFVLSIEIIVILLLLCAFCFWWYKWRPAKIVSTCANHAAEKAVEKNEQEGGPEGKFKASDRRQYYEWCLQENGLEK